MTGHKFFQEMKMTGLPLFSKKRMTGPGLFWGLKAKGGGVSHNFFDFLAFHISYSPGYPLSKMGSLAFQLCTVAEM